MVEVFQGTGELGVGIEELGMPDGVLDFIQLIGEYHELGGGDGGKLKSRLLEPRGVLDASLRSNLPVLRTIGSGKRHYRKEVYTALDTSQLMGVQSRLSQDDAWISAIANAKQDCMGLGLSCDGSVDDFDQLQIGRIINTHKNFLLATLLVSDEQRALVEGLWENLHTSNRKSQRMRGRGLLNWTARIAGVAGNETFLDAWIAQQAGMVLKRRSLNELGENIDIIPDNANILIEADALGAIFGFDMDATAEFIMRDKRVGVGVEIEQAINSRRQHSEGVLMNGATVEEAVLLWFDAETMRREIMKRESIEAKSVTFLANQPFVVCWKVGQDAVQVDSDGFDYPTAMRRWIENNMENKVGAEQIDAFFTLNPPEINLVGDESEEIRHALERGKVGIYPIPIRGRYVEFEDGKKFEGKLFDKGVTGLRIKRKDIDGNIGVAVTLYLGEHKSFEYQLDENFMLDPELAVQVEDSTKGWLEKIGMAYVAGYRHQDEYKPSSGGGGKKGVEPRTSQDPRFRILVGQAPSLGGSFEESGVVVNMSQQDIDTRLNNEGLSLLELNILFIRAQLLEMNLLIEQGEHDGFIVDGTGYLDKTSSKKGVASLVNLLMTRRSKLLAYREERGLVNGGSSRYKGALGLILDKLQNKRGVLVEEVLDRLTLVTFVSNPNQPDDPSLPDIGMKFERSPMAQVCEGDGEVS